MGLSVEEQQMNTEWNWTIVTVSAAGELPEGRDGVEHLLRLRDRQSSSQTHLSLSL